MTCPIFAKAGVTGYVRAFHDLRHTAITNDAAAGANPVALMTKAGHSSMATTRTYLHLAGTVFRDEANALESRMLGTRISTHASEPETTREQLSGSTKRVDDSGDAA
jgi:integrase